MLGLCNSLSRWSRSDGRMSPDQIADELIDLLMRGVRNSN